MNCPKLLIVVFMLLAAMRSIAQDTLIFENKHPYLVEVVEESETQVIYKKYPPQANLAYIIQKRFITDIRYKDPGAGKLKFRPDTLIQDKKLEVWVNRSGSNEINGLFHRMNDSTLILKKKSVLFSGGGKDAPEVVYIFPYNQISHISARKQNQIVRYALIGAGAGFFIGTVTGLTIFNNSKPCDPIIAGGECDSSLKSPYTRWHKSWALGFGSAGLGALAGGIAGSVKIKIPISGQKDMFNAAVPRLNRLDKALREK